MEGLVVATQLIPPPPTNTKPVASAADEPEPLERIVAAVLGPGSRVAGACRVPRFILNAFSTTPAFLMS